MDGRRILRTGMVDRLDGNSCKAVVAQNSVSKDKSMLPAPLTPADCDLRDFQFIPLDVHRLLTSETWLLGSGDEKAAAISLWLESWHQVPAGSLPKNDRILAHLSQAGQKWTKVKGHCLRGWVECSDGRIYHPVVSEKALEAWIEKLCNSLSGATGNSKRWGLSIDTERIKDRIIQAVEMLRTVAPGSRTLKKKIVVTFGVGSPPESPPESPGDRKGQGQGQGQGLVNLKASSSGEGAPEDPPPKTANPENPDREVAGSTALRAIELTVMLRKRGASLQASDPRVFRWAERGISDAAALSALEVAQSRRAERADPAPINAGYLDSIIGDTWEKSNGQRTRTTAAERKAAHLASLCSPRTITRSIDGTAERVD